MLWVVGITEYLAPTSQTNILADVGYLGPLKFSQYFLSLQSWADLDRLMAQFDNNNNIHSFLSFFCLKHSGNSF